MNGFFPLQGNATQPWSFDIERQRIRWLPSHRWTSSMKCMIHR